MMTRVGRLQFSAANLFGQRNEGLATITVNRTGSTLGTVTVNFAATNGSATSGQDYGASAGTLTSWSWSNESNVLRCRLSTTPSVKELRRLTWPLSERLEGQHSELKRRSPLHRGTTNLRPRVQ